MRKLIDIAMFKLIELRIWLHMKRNGTPFELFQFGLFWMAVLVLTSILIGKIL